MSACAQVSASSSAVMRGRWKLVLASRKCFGTPPDVSHDVSMPGFAADRWLLHELTDDGNSSPEAEPEPEAALSRPTVTHTGSLRPTFTGEGLHGAGLSDLT